MKKSHLLGAVCASLLSITVTPSLASVIYEYAGEDFDLIHTGIIHDTMSVTGTMEFALALEPNLTDAALSPSSFSFSDTVQTIDNFNADSSTFTLTTNSSGQITEWTVSLESLFPTSAAEGDTQGTIILTEIQDHVDVFQKGASSPFGGSVTLTGEGMTSVAGEWTTPAAVVPLPTAAWLFGSGLVGLVAAGRRRKK
jgi:hypothetical protein